MNATPHQPAPRRDLVTDDLPAILEAIQRDALAMYERAELLVGPLELRTAFGFILPHALAELASYWPNPREIARLETKIAGLYAYIAELEAQRPLVPIHIAAATASPYQTNDNGTTGNDTPQLTYAGNDYEGMPVLMLAPVDAVQLGATSAAAELMPTEAATAPPNPSRKRQAPAPAAPYDWHPDSPIWRNLPPNLHPYIVQFAAGTLTWRKINHEYRRQIVHYVLHAMGAPHLTSYQYKKNKPPWMPTANNLATQLKTSWANLYAVTSSSNQVN